MASAGTEQPETAYLSPDTVAQEIAQDYSNQWHILEQLKSSVAVGDPQTEANHQQNTTLTPKSTQSTSEITPKQDDGKDWYVLPDEPFSGHNSESECDSALEISDLKNNADYSYSSNRSVSSKGGNSQTKEHSSKDSFYQEQWHALEELKASVKAMQWSSDSSFDAAIKQESSSRTSGKGGDFVEPHTRTPAGSVNLTSGSIGSSESRESGVRSTLPSFVPSSHHSQSPVDMQFYSGTSVTSDQPDAKNTSSDLSLESENLAFAELPHRPATIGNYEASDGSMYPFTALPLSPQAFNVNVAAPQPSQYHTNIVPLVGSPLFVIPDHSGDSLLSKSPISARERLQPDGRDGPDIGIVPPTAPPVPGLVSYPLSSGSIQSSASHSGIASGFGAAALNVANDMSMNGTEMTQNTSAGNSTNNTSSRSQRDAPILTQSSHDSGSNSSMENVKEAQPFLSPWQPDANAVPSFHSEANNSAGTGLTWLSTDGRASHVTDQEQPCGSVGDVRSSISREELREVVLQRIEAHTHIPGLTSNADNQPQPDSGRMSAPPFVGNITDYPAPDGKNSRPHSYQGGYNSPRNLSSGEATPDERLTSKVFPRDGNNSNGFRDSSSGLKDSSNGLGDSLNSLRDLPQRQALPNELMTDAKVYQHNAFMSKNLENDATPKDHSTDRSDMSTNTSSYSRNIESVTSYTSPLNLQDKIPGSGSLNYLPPTSNVHKTDQFKNTIVNYSDKSVEERRTYSLPSVAPTAPLSTTCSDVPRPSLKLSHITNTQYGQSPVSRILGPNFKTTQDYLNKLKNERLGDTGVKSSSFQSQDDTHSEQQSYGSVSQNEVSSLSAGSSSYKPRKEAWSDERSYSHKPTSYSLGERDQSSSAKSFQQSFLPGRTVGNSISPSYPGVHHGTVFNELSAESERSLDSTGTYSKILPRSSYVQTVGGDSKFDDVFRNDDVSLKSLGSKAPLSTIQVPNIEDIHLRYAGQQQENGQPSKPFVMGQNDLLQQTSIDSANADTSLQKGQGLAPRGNASSNASFSHYETPLSSLHSVGGEARNLRYSGASSGVLQQDEGEDTDDLLSYEAALEGDIKYFRNQRNGSLTTKNYHSSSINSKLGGLTPTHLTGDISAISGTLDRDPPRPIPASTSHGSAGFGLPSTDELTKRYHLSLGAGEVRPVDDYRKPMGTLDGADYRKPMETLDEKKDYRVLVKEPDGTPEGENSEDELSSDELEVEEYEDEDEEHKKESYSSERNTSPGTESSSSSLYQPYLPIALRQVPSTERDSELTGNSSSTFGVYDIRQSSGPGSTNRRRKAMGLTPIPGRMPKPTNGIVYVSGDSSPLSMPDDASTDEHRKHDQQHKDETSRDTSKESLGSDLPLGDRERTSSRSNRHFEGERPRSSSKEGGYRARSRTSSFEEAKMIDDYIGGRKAIPHGKQKSKSSRSRNTSQSDESQSSKDFSTKNKDLNQMWERFQESLKSSPRSKSNDSVSSHLSRLSALLSKPIDAGTTSSEAESEQFRKPRSHSYGSSSSDVSTESDQPYQQQSYSLTRQIQLRKLLETVNIADVPTLPRLRHRDTTTTTSTLSDTSTSEVPVFKNNTSLPRSNRESRKVSKTPVLEPFVQTKPRSTNAVSGSKPKCICAIKSADVVPKHAHEVAEKKPQSVVDRKIQKPKTAEVGINFPSPKIVPDKKLRPSRPKKGFVDVAVQTKRDSDEDSVVHHPKRTPSTEKYKNKANSHEKSAQTSSSEKLSRRKERQIASQNSPGRSPRQSSPSRSKERHISGQNHSQTTLRSSDDDNGLLNGWDDSHEHSKSRKSKDKHKDRSHSKSTLNTSAPVWFYPVSNRHYSRPSTTPTVGPDRLRYDENTVNTFSPPAAAPSSSMQRLSLQDAFCFAKPEFIKRSRARLSRMNHNKNVRENGESKSMGEDRVSKMEIPPVKQTGSKPPTNPRTEKLHRPKPRQLTKKEMKTLNLKLYNNLPEVKAKKADDKRVNFYKTNRLRAKLYDKRVRENLKKRYAA